MPSIATAASLEMDTATAAQTCLNQIYETLGTEPDYLMVQTNAAHDIAVLREMAAETFSKTQIHGATSCLGSMTDQGVHVGPKSGLAMWALKDDAGEFGTAAVAYNGDPHLAATQALAEALDNGGRLGELPELIWVSAAPGCEEAIIAGLQSMVGKDVPIIGGSAADNAIQGDWRVFDRNQTLGEGLVISALFPSMAVGTAFHSGYAPTGQTATVTKATGRVIEELDGQPAAEMYRDWTGMDLPLNGSPSINVLQESTLAPLGRACGSLAGTSFYVLSHPAQIDNNGGVALFTDVAEGDEIELMTGNCDSLIKRPVRVCDSALEMAEMSLRSLQGGILVYCGGCMLAVQDRLGEVHQALSTSLPDVPFITAFTFGEQGPVLEETNRHGNLMISAVLFGG